jgi:sugar phosphate isomerase/epimerase
MAKLQVGVFADNLGLGVRAGIAKAAEMGADGIQLYTTQGDMLPENLSAVQRVALRQLIAGHGLTLSATCADFGLGLVDEERNRLLLPRIEANIDLAVDLGTTIVTTHIGAVSERRDDPVWGVLVGALNRIGAYAEQRGVVLATETGPEPGVVLRDLLEALDTAGIRVNLDPANFILRGFDHLAAVDALHEYIVHSHAKDATPLGAEVPLGEGAVDFPAYVAKLRGYGYDGFYTIEREQGADPIGDVQAGLRFLRSL